MEFLNRIKKEMSEGIVKAILEHHGYRVIDSGIEKVIREISCLPQELYIALGFPEAIKMLPDFVVMDKEQKTKTLVDVKYRSEWSTSLLFDSKIRAQLGYYKNITLIVINGTPPKPSNVEKAHDPAEAYIRCVCLQQKNGKDFVKWRGSVNGWIEINLEKVKNYHWFSSHSLSDVFSEIPAKDNAQVVEKSVKALAGIIGLSKVAL